MNTNLFELHKGCLAVFEVGVELDLKLIWKILHIFPSGFAKAEPQRYAYGEKTNNPALERRNSQMESTKINYKKKTGRKLTKLTVKLSMKLPKRKVLFRSRE